MSSPASPSQEVENPRSLLDAGIVASQANQPEQALQLFERAAQAAPGWALPHFLLGSELAARSDMDKAEAALANAVLLDPALHIARYQLGLLQFSSGRAAVALVTWQPLLEWQEPGLHGLPAFVRGFAALAQDDAALARQHFSEGLAEPDLNPAVAGDIRKVLAQIDAAFAPAAPPSQQQQQPSAQHAAAHVLVATYDKYKLH